MSIRDIFAIVFSLEEDVAALRATADIAARFDAQAGVLIADLHPGSLYAPDAAPLSEVLLDLAKGEQSQARQERRKIAEWLNTHAPHADLRFGVAEEIVGRRAAVGHARFADLGIVGRSPGHADARRAVLEDLLFLSGRPVLAVPRDWTRTGIGQRVLIGWNAKREAVRAVNDAMAFLRSAAEVVIATVDARPSATGHGEAPGADLGAHLARHGVKVSVSNLDSMGRSEAQTLTEAAAAMNADLIVIGAYGHTRAQEAVFGGVTADLLADCPLPLLLSH